MNFRKSTLCSLILMAPLFACGQAPPVASEAADVATNLDLLTQAIRSIGTELASVAEVDSLRGLDVQTQAPSPEVADLVEAVVVNELQRQGRHELYRVEAGASDVGDGRPRHRLELRVLELGVEYADRRGDGLFQRATVRRTAAVRVAAKLVSPQGRILWADERKAEKRDRVAVAAVGRVEGRAPAFARGRVPNPGGFLRGVVEPLFLAGAAGAVIYFFFTFRN